jgi:TPR repeat protein
MYENGCGVEQNLSEGVKLYRKAAAQNLDLAIKALKCLGDDQ